jgi:hypothetical protein
MNEIERAVLKYIFDKSHPGTLRPTTQEIHRVFGFPAAKRALETLQNNGYAQPMTPRRPHAPKRFQITDTGRVAVARVAA